MMLVTTSCVCGQSLWKLQLFGSLSMSGQFFVVRAKLPPSASSADGASGRSGSQQRFAGIRCSSNTSPEQFLHKENI